MFAAHLPPHSSRYNDTNQSLHYFAAPTNLPPSPSPKIFTTASPRLTASAVLLVQCSRISSSKLTGTTAKPMFNATQVLPSILRTSIFIISTNSYVAVQGPSTHPLVLLLLTCSNYHL